MNNARVLLADDHRIVREGVKQVIGQVGSVQVVGEYENASELCEGAVALKPELVLLDISMPKSKCAETIRFLKRNCPATKILVLTMHGELAYLNLCLEAGASGYVLKSSSNAELAQAVTTVLNGGVYIDPQLAQQVASRMQRSQTMVDQVTKTLSNREAEVLRLNTRGHTNKAIAELVGLSEKSVETYKARAQEKLGLSNRQDLLRYALEQGWLDNL